MDKIFQNFSYQSQSNIVAGQAQRVDSVTIGTSLSKVYIFALTFSSRYIDVTANNVLIPNCITFVNINTVNAGNKYSSNIPGLTFASVVSLEYSFQYSLYCKTGFIIQPNDQFRINTVYNTNQTAVNSITCITYYNFIGYQID